MSAPTTPTEPDTTVPAEPAKYNDKYDVESNGLPDPDATELDTEDAVKFLQEFLEQLTGESFRSAKVDFILAANKRGYDEYTKGQ